MSEELEEKGHMQIIMENTVYWARAMNFSRLVANGNLGPAELVLDYSKGKTIDAYISNPGSEVINKVASMPDSEIPELGETDELKVEADEQDE